jgi:hypothetical protein
MAKASHGETNGTPGSDHPGQKENQSRNSIPLFDGFVLLLMSMPVNEDFLFRMRGKRGSFN